MPRMRSQVLPLALKNMWSLGYIVEEGAPFMVPGVLAGQTCQVRLDTIYRFEGKSLRRALASSTCEIQAILALVEHQ